MNNTLLTLLLVGSATLAVAQTSPPLSGSGTATTTATTVQDTLPARTPAAGTDSLRRPMSQPSTAVTLPDTTLPNQPSNVASPADSTPTNRPAAVVANPDSTQPAQRAPRTGQPGRRAADGGMAPGMSDTQTAPPVIPGTSSDPGRGTAKITGILLDSTSKEPVQFASIALVDPATNKPIDGAAADDKGQFTINRVGIGEFNLLLSFIGYRNKTIRNVRVTRRGDDVNVGLIYLSSETKTLKEVTVTGQAALVEEKVDRLVFNAEKDLTAKGGDATDIMRKVPLLSVDLDGNVSLRGSSNVRVLINNKPSTIVASSVGDALKQIPADMIKTVEVITSPSAKYDAEGAAGIINIITKKNTLQGSTLNIDSGIGNRGANLGLTGSLRTGKMGFNLGGFGRSNYNVRGAFDNTQRTFGNSGVTTTRQIADTRSNGVFGQYTLSWDYDINKYNNLTASLRFGVRNNNSTQDGLRTETQTPTSTSLLIGVRDVLTKDLSNTLDASVDYNRTFEKPQKEFSVSAQYSRNNRQNNFIADILNNVDLQTITSRQRNDNLSYNQESTIRVDYQTPLTANQLIEFGGKGIARQVNSEYDYLLAATPNLGQFFPNPQQPGNTLDYTQNIAASYLSYTYQSKTKYTIKAGARYEYTFINANFSNERTSNSPALDQIPDYGNLVPSINISKALKGGKTVKLAYNRRIQRPGIQFLNPNLNQSNPLNISQGNPTLRPELNDNFEFSSSTYIKSVYINGSLFARFSNNAITSVTNSTLVQTGFDATNPVYQNALSTTFQNIGTENAYGLNLFGNATLFSKWQIGGGVDAYVAYLKGQVPTAPTSGSIGGGTVSATNTGMVISGRIFTNVTLKNGWGIQGFGFARGRQVQLQGYQGGFFFYNLGVKKDFKNKRGSVGLAAENFFNNPYRVRAFSETPGAFSRNSVTSLYNSGVRVNFSYRLGKMSFDQQGGRRRRGVNNDDIKEGEGNGDAPQGGQQQGGQQQGGGAPQGGGGRRGGPR